MNPIPGDVVLSKYRDPKTNGDGHAITYSWNPIAGPDVTLVGADTASPLFVAPSVTNSIAITCEVTVSDGRLISSDTVTVTVHGGG